MSAHAIQQPQALGMAAKEGSNIGAAFIIGAAIGAITGLLVAPKSGKEIREDIKNRGNDMNAKAHDKIDHVKDKAHDVTDKIKSKADQKLDTADDLDMKAQNALEKLDSRGTSL